EGVTLLREAQQRHPGDFWINYNLGRFLLPTRAGEAVSYCRAAVAIRPSSGQAYTLLGRALLDTGATDGAIAGFRKAIELDPARAGGEDLTRALARQRGLPEALLAWEKTLERGLPGHQLWHGYAELCAFLGKEQAYRRARRALLANFSDTTDPVVAE